MSDRAEARTEQPPNWWLFKTPLLVIVGAIVLLTQTSATFLELLPLVTTLLTGWLVWSIVSGAYPWSMRMI